MASGCLQPSITRLAAQLIQARHVPSLVPLRPRLPRAEIDVRMETPTTDCIARWPWTSCSPRLASSFGEKPWTEWRWEPREYGARMPRVIRFRWDGGAWQRL